jgi:hypothetical protein
MKTTITLALTALALSVLPLTAQEHKKMKTSKECAACCKQGGECCDKCGHDKCGPCCDKKAPKK